MDSKVLNIMLDTAKKITLKNDCVNDSGFRVGSALLCKNGNIYAGHNIENFGIQSTCSERTAFCSAISEGEKEFVGIVVIASDIKENKFVEAWPCGYCREFMSSIVGSEFEIYTIDENGNLVGKTISELAPLHDYSINKNYSFDKNKKISIKGNFFEVPISKNIEEKEINKVIDLALKVANNTYGYFQKEGAVIVGFNEKNEKCIFTGSTITDNNGSIIRAPKVALLKALSNGVRKFEKIICIKSENGKANILYPSYDVIQLLLQYAGVDFKMITYNQDENKVYENTIKEVLPKYFEF